MKKKQLQKLILAGLTCGLAVAAEANAQEGSSILLAGSGCGGGKCGSHTPSNPSPRGNGCSSSSRNQIADADEDQSVIQKKGNGCSASTSNSCGAKSNNNGQNRQGQ